MQHYPQRTNKPKDIKGIVNQKIPQPINSFIPISNNMNTLSMQHISPRTHFKDLGEKTLLFVILS